MLVVIRDVPKYLVYFYAMSDLSWKNSENLFVRLSVILLTDQTINRYENVIAAARICIYILNDWVFWHNASLRKSMIGQIHKSWNASVLCPTIHHWEHHCAHFCSDSLPAKIWNIFFYFNDFFKIFVGCAVCTYIWNTFLWAGITFGELISTSQQNEAQRCKHDYFNSCFPQGRLLPYPFACCIEILCTASLFIYRLFWCGQKGISVVGASHRRRWGIPPGDVHKILIYHKQHIFSYWIEGSVSLESLPLDIGPDIDLVCQTSCVFTNVVTESSLSHGHLGEN